MGFREIFLAILVLGLAVVASWHASGALSDRDALHVAAVAGAGVTTSPPAPVTVRALSAGTAAVRSVWAPTSLFRAVHLSAGVWLALAAALTALVAARLGAGDREERPGAALAAGLFAGAAVLFGRDTGSMGLLASPVPVLLVLLAGSAAALTWSRPRPLLGGLLLGLAVAEHPFVLFLLPAYGAMTIGATLRAPAEDGRRIVGAAWLGFALGCATLFLTALDAPGTGAGPALAAWWGGPDGPFWSLAGPRHWLPGLLDAVFAAWNATGPLGFVLGLAGLVVFFTGRARLGRPYLLAFLFPAAAFTLGEVRDLPVASALVGWTFLFWTVPMFVMAWDRFAGAAEGEPAADERARRRADLRTPVTALLAGGILVLVNVSHLDRSGERGIAWAESVVETLPPDAVLLTANPVHVAVSAKGVRPDVDVLYLPHPTWLRANREDRAFPSPQVPSRTDRVRAGEIQRLLEFCKGHRQVVLDARAYFDPVWREAILGSHLRVAPQGLAYRVIALGTEITNEDLRSALAAWHDVDPTPGTPANPLREGLDGDTWFGRALVQSASLWHELDRPVRAADEFLLALSHPAVNPNVAAMGMARIFYEQMDWEGAAATLEGRIRDDLEGAWIAHRLAANSLVRAGKPQEAREELRKAIQGIPRELATERQSMERLLESLPAGN